MHIRTKAHPKLVDAETVCNFAKAPKCSNIMAKSMKDIGDTTREKAK